MKFPLMIFLLIIGFFSGNAQVKQTVVDDNFYSSANGWPELNTQNKSAKISSGKYLISHNNTKGSAIFDISTDLYPGRNFFIEATGNLSASDKKNGFGIVWGKGSGGFYSFVITYDGRFYVRKAKAKTSGEYILGPSASNFIKKGFAVNTIRVQMQKDELVFFINNKVVGHITYRPFFGDSTGLILYGRQSAAISHFAVCGTSKLTAADNYTANLKIIGYAMSDGLNSAGKRMGNGDGKLQRGESPVITLYVKNLGRGKASGLKAVISPENKHGGVSVLQGYPSVKIPPVSSGETVGISFSFKLDPNFSESSAYFSFDVTDANNKLAQSSDFSVPLNIKIPSVEVKENSATINIKLGISDYDDINSSFPVTLIESRNTYAIVVGIKDYQNLPQALFADNDAKIFYNYLVKVLNVPRSNIIYLSQEKATLEELKFVLKPNGRFNAIVPSKGADVIFYFSGLGLCNSNSVPFLMPVDAQKNNPDATGYRISTIFHDIGRFNVNQAIFFFETNFAGVDRTGKPFIDDGGTFMQIPTLPKITQQNFAALYASAGENSNPVNSAKAHGLYTSYLLGAINTAATNRNSLNMQTLFSIISKGIMTECQKKGMVVVPKLDSPSKTQIFLIK